MINEIENRAGSIYEECERPRNEIGVSAGILRKSRKERRKIRY